MGSADGKQKTILSAGYLYCGNTGVIHLIDLNSVLSVISLIISVVILYIFYNQSVQTKAIIEDLTTDEEEKDENQQLAQLENIAEHLIQTKLLPVLEERATQLTRVSQMNDGRADKKAMYEGMQEMIPGLDLFAKQFGLQKSLRNNPHMLQEYLGLADIISGGKASAFIQEKLSGMDPSNPVQQTTKSVGFNSK